MTKEPTGKDVAPKTFAEKLDRLFRTFTTGPEHKERSYREVANAIEAAGTTTISASYIWQLRKGTTTNPTKAHLEALAAYFEVPVSYFFDDADNDRVDAELELLATLRDAGIRGLALRAHRLDAAGLRALTQNLASLEELQGITGHAEDTEQSPP